MSLIFSIVFATVYLAPFTSLGLRVDRFKYATLGLENQATDNKTQLDEGEGYCVLPPPLDHGRFYPSSKRCSNPIASAACQMIPGTPVPPQWVIFHSCNPGYKLQGGKTVSVCNKGKWVPPLPECLLDGCYLPKKPTHGSYQAFNQCKPLEMGVDVCGNTPGTVVPSNWTIKFTCRPGYYPNSTSDRSSCVDGRWTNPVECVSNECPRLKSKNVDVVCSYEGREVPCDRPVKPGTTATTKCSVDVSANQVLTCLDGGKWNRPLPECNPSLTPKKIDIGGGLSYTKDGHQYVFAILYTNLQGVYYFTNIMFGENMSWLKSQIDRLNLVYK